MSFAAQMIVEEEIRFRPATPADAAALRRLVRKYYASDQIKFDPRRVHPGLQRLLEDRKLGRAWFILRGRKVIGYVVVTFGFDYEFGGRVATITDLYLEPPQRGEGFGRRALAHVERFCRDAGFPALELQVERHNLRAARLYRSFGFERLDRIPMLKPVKP
jgi:ribosomal protein S18 acetylase RimI-like enzyme